ncbi:hypothetical protein P7228_06910 [Altererythrobacter arenosus]|uniref:DUF2059 domain-containing protein n=1 Tax=Altererythrobacter arenosus TaxID=3032592 RepID=A0ABY8FXJ2_9SPHN|nr:hypothetical protein [Altererythrobacter sp. CAU 1644]WFL78785.1 hypothetical protein P7228_06910 [Altererythrobacter sp. CAU 1644]
MIRKSILALGAGLALATQPVAAQDEPDAEAFAALSEMFKVEPLTAEQQARLPQAQAIIERMIPEGAMGEMMGSMFDGIMTPIMEMATKAPRGDVAKQLGVTPAELEMSDEELVELADMLDPIREQRNARFLEVMPAIMGEMMTAIEPTMRKAMAEAYAVYFDERELADIDAFFSTQSGLSFARKSFTMSSDPRVVGGMMEAMPAMFASMATIEARMEEATADLPPVRDFAQLSAAERKRVVELTGFSEAELREFQAAAASMEASE